LRTIILLVMLSILVALATADDCENKVNRCNSAFMVKGAGADTSAQMDCYEAIIEQDPACPVAWYQKAIRLRQMGKNVDALDSLNKSIQLNGDNHDYWFMKGMILLSLSNFKEAANAFSEAARIDPNSVDALEQEGFALNRSGKQMEDIAAYDKAIKALDLASSPDTSKEITLWYDKGNAYRALNDNDKAEEAYSKAKELKSKMNVVSEEGLTYVLPPVGTNPSNITAPYSDSNMMQQTAMPV
jgi:tetratricopeptide (TPR) repeat protein